MGFLRNFADGLGRAINPAEQARHERRREESEATNNRAQVGRAPARMSSRRVYRNEDGSGGYIRGPTAREQPAREPATRATPARSNTSQLCEGPLRVYAPTSTGPRIPWEDSVPVSQVKKEKKVARAGYGRVGELNQKGKKLENEIADLKDRMGEGSTPPRRRSDFAADYYAPREEYEPNPRRESYSTSRSEYRERRPEYYETPPSIRFSQDLPRYSEKCPREEFPRRRFDPRDPYSGPARYDRREEDNRR